MGRTEKEKEKKGKVVLVGNHAGPLYVNSGSAQGCNYLRDDPIDDRIRLLHMKWAEAQSTKETCLVPGGSTHLSR